MQCTADLLVSWNEWVRIGKIPPLCTSVWLILVLNVLLGSEFLSQFSYVNFTCPITQYLCWNLGRSFVILFLEFRFFFLPATWNKRHACAHWLYRGGAYRLISLHYTSPRLIPVPQCLCWNFSHSLLFYSYYVNVMHGRPARIDGTSSCVQGKFRRFARQYDWF